MNDFEERLPWRIAAVAGLLVGAVSAYAGVGLWGCLLRIGAAFALFGLAGYGLRAVLEHGNTAGNTRAGKKQGAFLDIKTPEMTASDLASSEEATPPSETSKT